MTRPTDNDRLAHALDYMLRGWPVLPVRTGEKVPACRHGVHDASTDPAQLARWFADGTLNIGIATGTPGPDVLDVDVRENGTGMRALRRLNDAALLSGATRVVTTPSGGLHLYFAGSGQGCGTLRGQFLDCKAAGGYVLAVPSRTPAGSYELREERRGTGAPLDWTAVTAVLCPPRPRARPDTDFDADDLGALVHTVAHAAVGSRANVFYWACRRAIEHGARSVEDLAELMGAAVTAGLGRHEVARSAVSALRAAGQAS